MTVTRGGRTGRPRCSPERAQDRRAHGGHRDAPGTVRHNLYKAFVLAAGRSAGGFLYSSPFFLSVWPRSWRTGRNTLYRWARACRTGRTSRRFAARHIVPAPCHAVPRGTVRTPCRLQRVDVRHSACTCERPAVPDRAACSCRAQTRGTVPGLCRRKECRPPWPWRILRARPCDAFRRSAGTKCDRARASPFRTSDTCRGRSARR